MKETTIELLNLVMLHCNKSESEFAFKTLQAVDWEEWKPQHFRNCILTCLNDLKIEFEEQS